MTVAGTADSGGKRSSRPLRSIFLHQILICGIASGSKDNVICMNDHFTFRSLSLDAHGFALIH